MGISKLQYEILKTIRENNIGIYEILKLGDFIKNEKRYRYLITLCKEKCIEQNTTMFSKTENKFNLLLEKPENTDIEESRLWELSNELSSYEIIITGIGINKLEEYEDIQERKRKDEKTLKIASDANQLSKESNNIASKANTKAKTSIIVAIVSGLISAGSIIIAYLISCKS